MHLHFELLWKYKKKQKILFFKFLFIILLNIHDKVPS